MKCIDRNTVIVLAIIVAASFFGYGRSRSSAVVASSDQATATATSTKLAALGFISGRWQTEFGNEQLEEQWSLPAGDSMMGAFRWMKSGKLWMNELFTIVDEGNQVVFRLKHFDAKMVGWEEKADPLTLKLIRNDANEAVFEGMKAGHPLKITYKMVGEGLLVRVESFRDGKPNTDEFTFRRAIEGKP